MNEKIQYASTLPVMRPDLFGGQKNDALVKEVFSKDRWLYNMDYSCVLSFEKNPEGGYFIGVANMTGNFDLAYDATGQLISTSFFVYRCLHIRALNDVFLAGTDFIQNSVARAKNPRADILVRAYPNGDSAYIQSVNMKQNRPILADTDGNKFLQLQLVQDGTSYIDINETQDVLYLDTQIGADIQYSIGFNRWALNLPNFFKSPTPTGAADAYKTIVIE